MDNFAGFVKDVKIKKPEEIKAEDLKSWRENIQNNEKEREKLTKIAMKQQEDVKQNFITSKLKSTKLTVIISNFFSSVKHPNFSKNSSKFQ